MALVLAIEDNAANMRLTVFLLEKAGHQVLQATSAEAGLQLARERHPDLIVMDIQLLGMDGLTATRLLKADDTTRQIKVLALTALAMSGDRERIRAAGCDGYLDKPLRYKNLWIELDRLLTPGSAAQTPTPIQSK